jgi:PAS domain S-box-containing protein
VKVRSGDHQQADPLRTQAESPLRTASDFDLEGMSRDEIQARLHDLEVHRVELKSQNEQLRAAQRETLASNERFQRLYDSAPAGYLTLDFDGTVLEANLTSSSFLKLPRSSLIERKLSSFIASHCQDRWQLALRELNRGRTRIDLTLEIVSAARDTIVAQVVAIQARGAQIGSKQVFLSLIDVTELRRTERALQAAVAAATLAEERERRKLASDLHDDAGQLLSLASMKLHALREAEKGERDSRMAELDELLVEIRRRVSSLSFQLSPPLLHDVGLVAAVQWLAEDLETSHGLVVKIVEEQELDLDENERVTLYRAIRELLLNVVKHSGVKRASVRFSRDGRMARVTVEDAGVGMPPRAKRYGFGLLALRERVEQLGGSLETHGSADTGTTVVVSLPTRTREQRGEV